MTESIRKNVLLFILAALAVFAIYDARTSAAREALALRELSEARVVAFMAVERGDSALVVADAANDAAAAAEAAEIEALDRAEHAESTAATESAVFWDAIKNAPDTCKVIVQSATNTITALETANTELHTAYDAAKLRADTLQVAVDTLVPALKDAQSAIKRLDRAAVNAVDAIKPGLLSRLMPHVGFGYGATLSLNGQITHGPTVFLGWTIR